MSLMSVKEAARKLDVTVGRVHQLIQSGRLPAEKLGSQYVIRLEDLKLVETRKAGRPVKKIE